jgi:hypothetical protein
MLIKFIQRWFNQFASALQQAADTEYVLRPEHSSCWITIQNISVHVQRTDEGVCIDLYPLNQETDEAIASTYAFFQEAESDEQYATEP